MKKLTAKEILEIASSMMRENEFGYGDWDEEFEQKVGEVEEVARYGGENKGSDWYSIKHFKNHDVYIRTDAYYQSYAGTEFDQGYGYEVKPQQKTITVYE